MAAPVTWPSAFPSVAFHVNNDHQEAAYINDDGPDAVEEREEREMEADDDAYLEEMSVRSRRSQNWRPTSSPEPYEENEITPAPLHNGKRDLDFGRTVTINEPVRESIEKDSGYGNETPTTDSPHLRRRRWGRTLSLPRTNTSRSFATFSTVLSDSWNNRHDPAYHGFWSEFWRVLVGTKSDEETGPHEGDPGYVPPKYRWTPILSGLLQPFSILLEIPGLTEHWYVHTVNNKPVVYQSNPVILDVGLAISMACAVVANIALISRFLERRVYTSTIITIIGLSIHDMINITAVTVFGVVHRFDDGFTYSEAFWLCVCSTVASMFTNATLIYDLIRTKDFRRSGSGLTPKQRSLVIIVMILLTYMAVGSLCFNFLLPEIAFQNALYYTVVSIETIGFGDITPSTIGAKVFLFFYIPLGILNLAVTVGTARDTLVESWNTAYRRRRHEVIRRHRLRKQQREEEAIRRAALERQLALAGMPVYVDTGGGGQRGGARSRKLNVKALSMDQLSEAESQAISEIATRQTSALGATTLPTVTEGPGGEDAHTTALQQAKQLQDELTQQSLMSEEGYREFQERMAKEEKIENLFKFSFAFSLFILFWIVGATVFSKTEGWSWFVGFYFCFVTFTTIGYGEVSPQTPAGRAFFIIWAIFGVATVTLLIAVLTEAYANRYKLALVQKGTRRALVAIKREREEMVHRRFRHEQAVREDEQRDGQGQGHNTPSLHQLPYEMLDVVRKWHGHVAASRHGAMEGTESEATTALINVLMEDQGLDESEKRELASDQESRKVLFWNGYERAVHELLEKAERAIRAHERKQSRSLEQEVNDDGTVDDGTVEEGTMDDNIATPQRVGRVIHQVV
ncbi:hypothetical protein BCR39DRAFT_553869 [Naematelia encephala]|uniref:Potassium channel domain-containing protein n=1 Tax=Naematelia encephala TaxID=71784 RepID=A0A1Y2AFR0_9TREE|nr:hypothetical protein BCR39DRAFT_553869 [Naematelia encephala]